MKKVTIDPVTRLEGHGKVEIFLDDAGEVAGAYFQVPELRGFEKFCEGRPVEELPRIVPRICGVCPGAHHTAAAKAVDAVYGVTLPPTGKKLRELFYMAHFCHSHIAHFYALAAPDFVMGPDADPAVRNILGVTSKLGVAVAGEAIKHRALAQEIQATLGGKATHPVCGVPGGMSKGLTEEERAEIEAKAVSMVEFAQFSLKLFRDLVLGNPYYLEVIKSEPYQLGPYDMGMVDEQGRVAFYEGRVRVTHPNGTHFLDYEGKDYAEHLEERVEPWTYLKFPILKKVGWKGVTDGADSGIYRVGPLGRLNVATGMATPQAQEAYLEYVSLLGKPVTATLAFHWARLIELLYAAERMVELIRDPEITSPEIRRLPTGIVGEGVGVVEAPRGTLYHHYKTDRKGLVTGLNIIVATTGNYAAIGASVARAAKGLIHGGNIDQGILNRVEMAMRAYDPCFGCATHAAPGEMPLWVRVLDASGSEVGR
ncbi:MAG TPA: Ni/Fe hydrogenase subunit alpha, partial [Symbiobacteriaceae bacterium]|nr:Ni/Fe hydrogenase subunit alpha [Symbiobacteriaceae bacterium]